jgi:chemotaxis protein MotB
VPLRKPNPRHPVIVKRVAKRHQAHAAGVWKIAYADFVTAMMAFFLLMWLLGSTSKGDLQGVADYFRTPLKVALTGGSSVGESPSVIQGGARGMMPPDRSLMSGASPFERPMPDVNAQRYAQRDDKAALDELRRKLEIALASNPSLAPFRNQVRLDVTTEGMRVQIVDDQARPMFDLGSAVVKDYMRAILRELGAMLNSVDHKVTLAGHTDAKLYAAGDRGYSNWELSADRANASRRELIAGGMDERKIIRVVGVGSSVMLNADDPNDPVNRRISIVVMNRDAERRVLRDMSATPLVEPRALAATPGDAKDRK